MKRAFQQLCIHAFGHIKQRRGQGSRLFNPDRLAQFAPNNFAPAERDLLQLETYGAHEDSYHVISQSNEDQKITGQDLAQPNLMPANSYQ
jgi:hypothetical protein